MGILDRDSGAGQTGEGFNTGTGGLPPVGDPNQFVARRSARDQIDDRLIDDTYIFSIWVESEEDWFDFTYAALKEEGILPPGLDVGTVGRGTQVANTFQTNLQKSFDDYVARIGGSGRGGGGGGGAGATYVAPDERLVRDAVKAKLALWVGKADEGLVNQYTELYMSEAKRAFGLRESEQVDPMASVEAKIREQSDYKAIHQLRPDAISEDEWVSSRQGGLIRAGVSPKIAEQLGITQATIGASDQNVVKAGSTAMFAESGQQLDELKNRMRTSMYGVLSVA